MEHSNNVTTKEKMFRLFILFMLISSLFNISFIDNVIADAPNLPSNPYPSDGETVSGTGSVPLNVLVSDPDNDLMDVIFYQYVDEYTLSTDLTDASDDVRSVFVDDEFLYVGSYDTNVRVYYKNNLTIKTILSNASDYIYSIFVDDNYIYASGQDCKVQIYYKTNYTLKTEIIQSSDPDPIWSVYVDDNYIYLGGRNNEVLIYYKTNYTVYKTLADAGNVVHKVYADDFYLYAGGFDNRVQVYYKNNFTLKTEITDADRYIYSIFADDDYVYYGGINKTVWVYDKNDFTFVTELTEPSGTVMTTFSDGAYIYVGGLDNKVQIYYKNNFTLKTELAGASDWVYSVTADDDCIYVGSRDDNAYVYDKEKIGVDTNVPSNTQASCVWSGLETNVEYKWFTVVSDGEKSNFSDIWSFTLNSPPILTDISPSNGSIDQNLSFSWSVNISDLEGNPLNWTINCNDNQFSHDSADSNGTKQLYLNGLDYNTEYLVWVNVSDNDVDWVSEWFTFTTKTDPNDDILAEYVNIGDSTSESDYELFGFGPIINTTSASYGNGDDGNARTIWYNDTENPSDIPTNSPDENYVLFNFTINEEYNANRLILRMLDGAANDSFDVYVNNNLVYTYYDQETGLVWKTHEINISSLNVTSYVSIKIVATGEKWINFDTYGQSCLSWVKVYTLNNSPLNASFSYSASALSVSFFDESTDLNGTITSWYWDFGDENNSTEQNPTHIYENIGVYYVTLTVVDNNGINDSYTTIITVSNEDFNVTAFNPIDDDLIKKAGPDENYGDHYELQVRNTYGFDSSNYGWDSLINFDISSLPEDINISSANLYLYYNRSWNADPSGRDLSLYRIINSWDEDTVTWNNQPSCESLITSISTLPASAGVWMSWNVTEDVKNFTNGTYNNYGWKIIDEEYWGSFDIPAAAFASKENANSALIPYLEIISYNGNVEEEPPEDPPEEDPETGGGDSGGDSSGGNYVSSSDDGSTENQSPTANAGGPYSGSVGEEITLDGSGSSDPEGSQLQYRWDFDGDGIYDIDWSTTPTTNHVYSNSGKFTVKIEVKDEEGLTATDTTTANITTDAQSQDSSNVNETNSDINANQSYNNSIGIIFDIQEKLGLDSTTALDIQNLDDIEGGYLVDIDDDGQYDKFYSSTSEINTDVKLEDGKYLIDSDGDGNWDYSYNPATGGITPIGNSSDGSPLLSPAASIGIAIAVMIIVIRQFCLIIFRG